MSATTTAPSLEDKTRELCQFIIDSPNFVTAQGRCDAFDDDVAAQKLYQNWREFEMDLHRRHQEGYQPNQDDIAKLEKLRGEAMKNSTLVDFVEAEEALNGMFGKVVKILQRTLQTGAVPTDEELEECCGSGG